MSVSLETILNKIKKEFRQEIITTIDNKVEQDLLNYYKKSDTYTKLEVNNLIKNVGSLKLVVVESLPTEDIDTSTIYLLPKKTSGSKNIYDEYIYINQWELIGTTDVDLSEYVSKTELEQAFVDNTEVVVSSVSPVSENWKMWIDETTDISSESQEIAQEILDYYRRGETYTRSEVDSLVSNLGNKECIDTRLFLDEVLSSNKAPVNTQFDTVDHIGVYGNKLIPVLNLEEYEANESGNMVKYVGQLPKKFKISAAIVTDTSKNTIVEEFLDVSIERWRYDYNTLNWQRTYPVTANISLTQGNTFNTVNITPTIIELKPNDVISILTMSNSCTFKGLVSSRVYVEGSETVHSHYLIEEV